MALHGHTKILLTDAKTGKSRVVADKQNTLTGALADIYKPLGMYANGNILLTNCCSLQSLFGGLLVFDRSIEPENYAAPDEARIVAAGVYGTSNNGSNQIRGTYNATESSIDYANKKATFVYDFATNQGNGTIASVCLTPLFGGYLNEAEAITSTTGVPYMFLRNYYEANLQKTVYDNYGSTGNNPERGAWGRIRTDLSYYGSGTTGSGTSKAWYRWQAIEVDEETDTILFARLDWTYSDTALTLTLERYAARLKSASVWECYGSKGDAEVTTINLGDMLHSGYDSSKGDICLVMNYDWERRLLWIVNPDCTKDSWSTSYGCSTKKLLADGAIRLWAVDVDTGEFTQYDITNQTGVDLGCTCAQQPTYNLQNYLRFYVYDGWLYAMKFDATWGTTVYVPVYRINIANPSRIDKAQGTAANNNEWRVDWAQSGRIYFNSNYQNVLLTGAFTSNAFAKIEVNSAGSCIPVKGRPHMLALDGNRLVLRSNTLMTYNNITEVEKTAAQTMKIIYTLSEV